MNILVPNLNRYSGWLTGFDELFEATNTSKILSLSAEIEDADNYMLLSFDLPGMKEEDLTVKVEGEQLFISGERKREEAKTQKSQLVYNQLFDSRRYGKFEKIYSLPETIDAKKIEADYRDGVLRVYLPKIEVKKADVFDVPVKGKGKDTFLDRLLGSVSQH